MIDAVHEVLRYTGQEAEIKLLPHMPTGPLNRVASNRLAKELLGWEPRMKFMDGLHRTIDWYFGSREREAVSGYLQEMLTERRRRSGRHAPHRLVYLCDWLPPDFGAVGQYSLLFARQRAAQGEDVVLAGLSSAADSVEEERPGAGGCGSSAGGPRSYDRADFRARALWTARTDLGLVWRLRRELRAADGDPVHRQPPFLIQLLVPLNLLLGKRLTYRITDFHPECLMAEMAGGPGAAPALPPLDGGAAPPGGPLRGAGGGPAAGGCSTSASIPGGSC